MEYEVAYYIAAAIILVGVFFIFNGLRRMFFSGHFSGLVFGWSIVLLLIKFQYLYSSWVLRPENQLDMMGFLMLVAIAAIWAFLAAILFPTDFDNLDLDEHYFSRSALMFFIAAFNIILNLFFGFLIINEALFDVKNLYRIVFAVVCLFLMTNSNRFWHFAAMIVFIIIPFLVFMWRF